jgi:hypothetical protein
MVSQKSAQISMSRICPALSFASSLSSYSSGSRFLHSIENRLSLACSWDFQLKADCVISLNRTQKLKKIKLIEIKVLFAEGFSKHFYGDFSSPFVTISVGMELLAYARHIKQLLQSTV